MRDLREEYLHQGGLKTVSKIKKIKTMSKDQDSNCNPEDDFVLNEKACYECVSFDECRDKYRTNEKRLNNLLSSFFDSQMHILILAFFFTSAYTLVYELGKLELLTFVQTSVLSNLFIYGGFLVLATLATLNARKNNIRRRNMNRRIQRLEILLGSPNFETKKETEKMIEPYRFKQRKTPIVIKGKFKKKRLNSEKKGIFYKIFERILLVFSGLIIVAAIISAIFMNQIPNYVIWILCGIAGILLIYATLGGYLLIRLYYKLPFIPFRSKPELDENNLLFIEYTYRKDKSPPEKIT